MTPGSPSEDRQPPQEGTLPLVVDLDDALSPAQASIEALAGLAMKQPQALPSALLAIARGRPAVKVLLAQRDAYSASALPLREDVLEYLRASTRADAPCT